MNIKQLDKKTHGFPKVLCQNIGNRFSTQIMCFFFNPKLFNFDFEVLIHILKLLGPEPFMVEIGVDRAQTSEMLLTALPNLTLLGVDPYPGRYNGQVSANRLDQMGAEDNMRSLE